MGITTLCDDIWIVIFSYLDMSEVEVLTSSFLPQLSSLYWRAAKHITYDLTWGKLSYSGLDDLYLTSGSCRLTSCSGIHTIILDLSKFGSHCVIWSSFMSCARNYGTIQLEHLDLTFHHAQHTEDVRADIVSLITGDRLNSLTSLRLNAPRMFQDHSPSSRDLIEHCPLLTDIDGVALGYIDDQNSSPSPWPCLGTMTVEILLYTILNHVDGRGGWATRCLQYMNTSIFPAVYRLLFRHVDADDLLEICLERLCNPSPEDCLMAHATCIEFGGDPFEMLHDPFRSQQIWTAALGAFREATRGGAQGRLDRDDRPLPTTRATPSPFDTHCDAIFLNALHVRLRDLLPSRHLLDFIRPGSHNHRHFDPRHPSALVFGEAPLVSTDRVGDAIPRSWKDAARRQSVLGGLPSSTHGGIILQGASDDLVLSAHLQNTWNDSSLPVMALILYERVRPRLVNDMRRCASNFHSALCNWKFRNVCVLHINDLMLRRALAVPCTSTHPSAPCCCSPLLCACNYLPHLECLAVELMTFDVAVVSGENEALESDGKGSTGHVEGSLAVSCAVDFIQELRRCQVPLNWTLLEFTLPIDRSFCEVAEAIRLRCVATDYQSRHDCLNVTSEVTRVFLSRRHLVCDTLFDIHREVTMHHL